MVSQYTLPLVEADQEAEAVMCAPCRVDDGKDDLVPKQDRVSTLIPPTSSPSSLPISSSSSSPCPLSSSPSPSSSNTASNTQTETRPPAKKYQRLSINLSLLKPAVPVHPVVSSSTTTSPSAMSPALPSSSYSASPSCSSLPTPSLHSPSKHGDHASSGGVSPILNPFQWTSDLRQYIITDIGPQPTNSQIPALRAHHYLTRQRSFSKLGSNSCGKAYRTLSPSSAATSPGCYSPYSPTSPMESVYPHQEYRSLYGTYSGRLCGRYGSTNDLCTIPQDEPLPPTPITVDRRMLYSDWDDDLTDA